MSTKHQKLHQTFDFIEFQDNLQPLLDSFTVSSLAISLKAKEHEDHELTAIGASTRITIKRIEELCGKYHELNKGRG